MGSGGGGTVMVYLLLDRRPRVPHTPAVNSAPPRHGDISGFQWRLKPRYVSMSGLAVGRPARRQVAARPMVSRVTPNSRQTTSSPRCPECAVRTARNGRVGTS